MGFEAWEFHMAVKEWKCVRVDCQNDVFSCFSCDQSRTKATLVQSRSLRGTSRSGPARSECCPPLNSSLHDIASSAQMDPP